MWQRLLPIWIDWLRARVIDLKDDDPLNFIHSSGSCICEICGREYRRHVVDDYLHVLCDGSRVKL